MKKHILCFGDSNTHGYCADPSDCANPALLRFDEGERWPMRLQQGLGSDYLVIEEGCSGRTTVFADPITPGMSALDYIHPCLKSHEPIALLIIMLGTNDTKERFGANAFVIGQGMTRLIKAAKEVDCWGGKNPNILLISPPSILEGIIISAVIGGMGKDCVEKSKQLSKEYQQVANQLNCHFLDANEIGCIFNQVDFMHLTAKAHGQLADALIDLVPQLLP